MIDVENSRKLYLSDGKVYKVYSLLCFRSSQYHLPWRTITPTHMLPTSQTLTLLPQIFPTLFGVNL